MSHSIFRLLPIGLVSSAISALGEHTTKLRGIINIPDMHCALVELNHSFAHSAALPPSIFTRTWLIKEGTSYVDQTIKGAHVRVEVVNVDLATGRVILRENGRETVCAFETNHSAATTATGKFGLRLEQVRIEDLHELYVELKSRNALIHPQVARLTLALQASAQSKVEVTEQLERAFLEFGIATVPDGNAFVLLVPKALQAAAITHSKLPEVTSTNLHSVAFDCPLDVLIEEYGRTSGRTRADGERLPSTQVILRATNLSEPQLLHAFDTVLAWHGLKIATQDEKTFKVVRLPESRETIPPPPPAPPVREVPARYRPLIFYTNDNATIAPLTYTDKQRGVTYRVESDGRHVSASAADGKLLWRRNPFVEAQMEPYRYTKPLIRQIGAARDIDFRGDPDAIWIRFNSSQSGTIDPRTGEFHYVFRE